MVNRYSLYQSVPGIPTSFELEKRRRKKKKNNRVKLHHKMVRINLEGNRRQNWHTTYIIYLCSHPLKDGRREGVLGNKSERFENRESESKESDLICGI